MRKDKHYKRPKSKMASLDGIVSDGRQLGQPWASRQTADGTLEAVVAKGDGFHPLRQSPAGLGRSVKRLAVEDPVMDDAIVLGEKPAKQRFWRRWQPKNPRSRLVLKHFVLAASAFLLVGGAFMALKLFLAYRNVLQGGGNAPALAADIDINQLRGEGDGRINVLLLGIGGPGHDGEDLTDTIMIASIDPINHKTVLLSVPRDLWVAIPNDGYQKINAAYYYGKLQTISKNRNTKIRGGLKLLDDTLKPVLGIPIHYHGIVNFKAFKEGVDAVGGITINVPETLYDPTVAWENNYNPTIAKKGPQQFNGQRALLYAKSRQTSTDFARSERQRLVMLALKEKVFSAGTYGNPIRISQLLNSVGKNVYTDFSITELTRLYQITSQIPSTSVTSLDLIKPPHDLLTTSNINGLSVVVPKAGTFNYAAIQHYVRNKLRDGFLAKEDAQVAVYNATDTAGLATKLSGQLKSYGYKVKTVANSPNATNPPQSVVVDLTGGQAKYTRYYLEKRFGLTAQNNLPPEFGIAPPAGTQFVIILGKDQTAQTQ